MRDEKRPGLLVPVGLGMKIEASELVKFADKNCKACLARGRIIFRERRGLSLTACGCVKKNFEKFMHDKQTKIFPVS
jgi:hypothetical protein